MPQLVLGVDSSTQSCKVIAYDFATGDVVREKEGLRTPLEPKWTLKIGGKPF